MATTTEETATRHRRRTGRARAGHARPGWVRSVWAGLVAGLVSAFVKLGWEMLLPPRTGDRVEPPLLLLDKVGLDPSSATFTFSGTEVSWASLAVHGAFSVGVVLVYCLLARVWRPVTVLWGAAYGLVVLLVAHGVALPVLGLTPAPWDLPADEWISEAGGHVVWLVSAELVRRGLVRPPPAPPSEPSEPAGPSPDQTVSTSPSANAA